MKKIVIGKSSSERIEVCDCKHYANKENFTHAIKDFQEALNINPKHNNAKNYLIETLLTRGKMYTDEHELEEACEKYTDVLRIDPGNVEAREMLSGCQRLMAVHSSSKEEKNSELLITKITDTLQQLIKEDKKEKTSSKKRKKRARSSSSSSSSGGRKRKRRKRDSRSTSHDSSSEDSSSFSGSSSSSGEDKKHKTSKKRLERKRDHGSSSKQDRHKGLRKTRSEVEETKGRNKSKLDEVTKDNLLEGSTKRSFSSQADDEDVFSKSVRTSAAASFLPIPSHEFFSVSTSIPGLGSPPPSVIPGLGSLPPFQNSDAESRKLSDSVIRERQPDAAKVLRRDDFLMAEREKFYKDNKERYKRFRPHSQSSSSSVSSPTPRKSHSISSKSSELKGKKNHEKYSDEKKLKSDRSKSQNTKSRSRSPRSRSCSHISISSTSLSTRSTKSRSRSSSKRRTKVKRSRGTRSRSRSVSSRSSRLSCSRSSSSRSSSSGSRSNRRSKDGKGLKRSSLLQTKKPEVTGVKELDKYPSGSRHQGMYSKSGSRGVAGQHTTGGQGRQQDVSPHQRSRSDSKEGYSDKLGKAKQRSKAEDPSPQLLRRSSKEKGVEKKHEHSGEKVSGRAQPFGVKKSRFDDTGLAKNDEHMLYGDVVKQTSRNERGKDEHCEVKDVKLVRQVNAGPVNQMSIPSQLTKSSNPSLSGLDAKNVNNVKTAESDVDDIYKKEELEGSSLYQKDLEVPSVTKESGSHKAAKPVSQDFMPRILRVTKMDDVTKSARVKGGYKDGEQLKDIMSDRKSPDRGATLGVKGAEKKLDRVKDLENRDKNGGEKKEKVYHNIFEQNMPFLKPEDIEREIERRVRERMKEKLRNSEEGDAHKQHSSQDRHSKSGSGRDSSHREEIDDSSDDSVEGKRLVRISSKAGAGKVKRYSSDDESPDRGNDGRGRKSGTKGERKSRRSSYRSRSSSRKFGKSRSSSRSRSTSRGRHRSKSRSRSKSRNRYRDVSKSSDRHRPRSRSKSRDSKSNKSKSSDRHLTRSQSPARDRSKFISQAKSQNTAGMSGEKPERSQHATAPLSRWDAVTPQNLSHPDPAVEKQSLTDLEKFLIDLKHKKKKQWIAEGKLKEKN